MLACIFFDILLNLLIKQGEIHFQNTVSSTPGTTWTLCKVVFFPIFKKLLSDINITQKELQWWRVRVLTPVRPGVGHIRALVLCLHCCPCETERATNSAFHTCVINWEASYETLKTVPRNSECSINISNYQILNITSWIFSPSISPFILLLL